MLSIPLLIDGSRLIGRIEIGRARTGADGVHTYAWTVFCSGDPNGLRTSSIVQHRESDGPFELLTKVLEAFRSHGGLMSIAAAGHGAMHRPSSA